MLSSLANNFLPSRPPLIQPDSISKAGFNLTGRGNFQYFCSDVLAVDHLFHPLPLACHLLTPRPLLFAITRLPLPLHLHALPPPDPHISPDKRFPRQFEALCPSGKTPSAFANETSCCTEPHLACKLLSAHPSSAIYCILLLPYFV